VELLLAEVEADEVVVVAPCSEGERSHRRRKGRGAVGGGREGAPKKHLGP